MLIRREDDLVVSDPGGKRGGRVLGRGYIVFALAEPSTGSRNAASFARSGARSRCGSSALTSIEENIENR